MLVDPCHQLPTLLECYHQFGLGWKGRCIETEEKDDQKSVVEQKEENQFLCPLF
jgi:hypothetical protein